MSDETFAEEALTNAPVMIRLGGKDYPFCEPVKRRCVELFAKAMRIITDHGLEDMEFPEGEEDADLSMAEMAPMIEAFSPMLGVVYDALGLSQKERIRIDNAFEFKEVGQAFGAVLRVLRRPFGGSRRGTAANAGEGEKAPSESSSSTTG